MSIQPQVDVEIINELMINNNRKTFNPFKIRRLEKAVSALESSNPIEGITARAHYLSYMNKNDDALAYITNAIERYGYNRRFIHAQIAILRRLGDFSKYKRTIEDYLISIDIDSFDDDILNGYIGDSILYMNLEGKFYNIIDKFNVYADDFINNANYIINAFKDYDIERETFEKVLDTSFRTMYLNYNGKFEVSLRFKEQIQIIFSNKNWTIDEAIEQTKMVNEAIDSIDDLNFQLEADEIECFCINFDSKILPEDFSFYEEEFEPEFIELLKERIDASENEFEVLNV